MKTRRLSLFLLFLMLSGCGRYGVPLAPEAYAPAAVQEISATAQVDGILFKWRAPDDDRRGDTLRSLAYYDIRRVEGDDLVDFLRNPYEGSELVGRSYDQYYRLLEALREEARANRTPVRKVKVEDTLKAHTFLDSSVEPGKLYIYQIVPVDEDGVPGEVLQYVRVKFSGITSVVEVIDSSWFQKPYTLQF